MFKIRTAVFLAMMVPAVWAQGQTPTPTVCAGPDTATAFNQATIETFTGEAMGVQDLRRLFGVADYINFVLRTEQNENWMVSLGPGSYLEENNFELSNGDRVTVTGSRVTIQGRPTLMATEIEKNGQRLQLRNQNGVPVWEMTPERQTAPEGQPGEQTKPTGQGTPERKGPTILDPTEE